MRQPFASAVSLALGATLLSVLALQPVRAQDTKATITALEERLAKIGAPRVEGTMKQGDKEVPALFFGARRINGNYDVVDEVKKQSGATATIFVKDGEEFTRVSTNVLTPEGKRGVGTQLARAKAYEAVKSGKEYCGDVDVLGTPFHACYRPLKDAGGAVIGVTYIGFKK
jgi:hypothetical protein